MIRGGAPRKYKPTKSPELPKSQKLHPQKLPTVRYPYSIILHHSKTTSHSTQIASYVVCKLIKQCAANVSTQRLSIYDRLWEDPSITHKDKYLEIYNCIVQSIAKAS